MKISRLLNWSTRWPVLLVFGVFSSGPALCQSARGVQAQANSLVSIIKPDTVRISGLDDLVLGTHHHLEADLSTSDTICVFSSSGSYALVVTSANGLFVLRDPETSNEIPYTLDWLAQGPLPLSHGERLSGLSASSADTACEGSGNAGFRATIPAELFNSADPGEYSDTLTFLVQPE